VYIPGLLSVRYGARRTNRVTAFGSPAQILEPTRALRQSSNAGGRAVCGNDSRRMLDAGRGGGQRSGCRSRHGGVMECTLLQRRGNAAPPLWRQSGLQRGPFGDLAVAACPCSVVPCEQQTQRRWGLAVTVSQASAHNGILSRVTGDPSAVVTVCTECPLGDRHDHPSWLCGFVL
jgi:hypothetical protein